VVGIVVLAAGGSTRLGRPKQLVPFRGVTLLRHAVEVALGAAARPADAGGPARSGAVRRHPVVVVIGAEGARTRTELAGLRVLVVDNQRWREGLSTSLRAGLTGLDATADPDAALFTTCDQPHVSPELLRSLVLAYEHSRPPIVACVYGGAIGVPALFDRSLFTELRELQGDAGAKRVIEAHRRDTVTVPFPGGEVDIDTAEDAARLGHGQPPATS
jgi:molybdenum cofactor cytidylyltransferase